MPVPKPLLTGLTFPESPRWHDGRLWVADWGAHQVVAVDPTGQSEVVSEVASFPFSIDWLPDGRMLAVSARDRRLLRREPNGALVAYAELSSLSERPWNEIVVDGKGNIYLNNIGFDFPGGDFAPGTIALVTPDGSAHQVADGVAFPNGMVVTPDNSTLVLAESYGSVLTAFTIAADGSLSGPRVWPAWTRACQTVSVWTPKAPFGMQTCPTNNASGCARAVKLYRSSTSTVVASPACSGAPTAERSTSWLTSGPVRPRWAYQIPPGPGRSLRLRWTFRTRVGPERTTPEGNEDSI